MSVLDELRNAALDTIDFVSVEDREVELDAVFDAFEAAHPGLYDTTVPCHRCGNPCSGGEWESVYQNGAPGRPSFVAEAVCPSCTKETT